MTIKELNTDSSNPYITVTLSYDEIREISNGLYARCTEVASDGFDVATKDRCLSIYKKAATLFGLIKDGKITGHLLHTLNTTDVSEFP